MAPQGVGYTNGLPTSVSFHHWALGFRQSSFRPIVQALQGHRIPVFCGPPLSNHALVPSQSSALNSGLLGRQFTPCVTWRTLSPHTAHDRGILREGSISPTPRSFF